jgi:hypothetical protein
MGVDVNTTHPAHPAGGRVGVVTELLCHPGDAAAEAELPQGAADRLGNHNAMVDGRQVNRIARIR